MSAVDNVIPFLLFVSVPVVAALVVHWVEWSK